MKWILFSKAIICWIAHNSIHLLWLFTFICHFNVVLVYWIEFTYFGYIFLPYWPNTHNHYIYIANFVKSIFVYFPLFLWPFILLWSHASFRFTLSILFFHLNSFMLEANLVVVVCCYFAVIVVSNNSSHIFVNLMCVMKYTNIKFFLLNKFYCCCYDTIF